VGYADAACLAPAFGVCDRSHGVWFSGRRATLVPVHNKQRAPGRWGTQTIPDAPRDSLVLVRLTADLSANTVRVAVEYVPREWALRDPRAH
jgi:hypothetical protein